MFYSKCFLVFVWFVCFFGSKAEAQLVFNPVIGLAPSTFDNLRPRISVDRQGEPMVVWYHALEQSVYFSRWNGTGFGTPNRLTPLGFNAGGASWMGPEISSFGDTVYIVVKKMPETIDSNRVFLYRSFDGGNTFLSPTQLAFINDSLSWLPTVSVDNAGHPLVAFIKTGLGFTHPEWVFSRSNDYGASFEPDVLAGEWSGPNSEACDCCPGSIAATANRVNVTYRDNLNDVRDIWSGFSADGGNSFTNGIAVDNNNWMAMSCPASGPDTYIHGDTLYTVFMSRGNGSFRNYISKTSLTSQAMISFNALADTIVGLTQQNLPRIAGSGSVAAIAWRQVANATVQLPLLINFDIGGSGTWQLVNVDSDYITNTDVAVSNDAVHVVWQDDNAGLIQYRKGNFATSSLSNNHSDNSTPFNVSVSSNDIIVVSSSNQTFSVSMVDAYGKMIVDAKGSGTWMFDRTSISTGVYFINVTNGNQTTTRKLLLN